MNTSRSRKPLRWLALVGFFGSVVAQQPINEGLDGAWLNPQTPGQGILLDVDEEASFLFLAWFTYDPAGVPGEDNHRWFTAQGNYAGDSATLTLTQTQGGEFAGDDPVEALEVGSVTIAFSSCTTAQLTYFIEGADLSGTISLQRLAPDVLCEALTPLPRDVTVTYVGNQGVHISDGEDGVMVDAFGNFNGWVSTPLVLRTAIQSAQAPFDTTGLIVGTHNHGDHLVSSLVTSFLAAQPAALVLVPPGARNSYAPDQVIDISPARFTAANITTGEAEVTIINTRHFNQFGNDFSGVDNYVVQVAMGGCMVLHMGDIDYAEDNFQAVLRAIGGAPDLIILPTFNTLISPVNRDLVRQFFPESKVVGAHFQAASLQTETQQLLALFPEAEAFDEPGESLILQSCGGAQ